MSNKQGFGSASPIRATRACDSCRSRKIRCDRSTPCSNCRASKLKCMTILQAPKPASSPKVQVSEAYEKKIDRIEDRLDGIDRMLDLLNAQLDQNDQSTGSRKNDVDRTKRQQSANLGTRSNSGTGTPFEGETTMTTQFTAAQELLEQAVSNNQSIGQNLELQNSLQALHDLVNRQGQVSSTFPTDKEEVKEVRPTWDMVEELIDDFTAFPTLWYPMIAPMFEMSTLREIFQDMTKDPEHTSPSRRVTGYGLWYNLLAELAFIPQLSHKKDRYLQWVASTKVKLNFAIHQLDSCLTPSYDNVVTLLVAAWYGIELSKPSFCWTMTSTASNMCQTLGYHRYTTMQNDSDYVRTAKLYIYWSIYTLDKSLSLRLGRASAISDWDISLPFPNLSGTSISNAFAEKWQAPETIRYWIEVARIQGKTYELLYSPAAFLKSTKERSNIATGLVHALDQAWMGLGEGPIIDTILSDRPFIHTNTTRGCVKNKPPPHNHDHYTMEANGLFHHGDIVLHCSTATLIHRAVSRDSHTLTHACVSAARAALVTHKAANDIFNIKGNEILWAGYVHWSILQAPFTPFIVLFTSLIQDPSSSSSGSSLSILSSFVQSLKSCRDVSEGANKLYKMCSLFLSIATIYVEAKNNESSTSAELPAGMNGCNDLTQFDPYLSALGLLPNEVEANSTQDMFYLQPTDANAQSSNAVYPPTDPNFTGDIGITDSDPVLNQYLNSNPVQEWFSGSRYLISLMEDDIQMPDFAF